MRVQIIAILLACGISAYAQVPGIRSADALDRLLSTGLRDRYVLDLHAAKDLERLKETMAVYRIMVKADGTLDRWERITGYQEFQDQAEQSLAQWRFGPVLLNGKNDDPTPWWSVVGVCYGSGWGMLVPCEPPPIDISEFKETTLPVRVVLPISIAAAISDKFEFGPLKKIKGSRLSRPEIARIGRIQGSITIVFSITPEGKVGKRIGVMTGHPLLAREAGEQLKGWRFAPITMLGDTTPSNCLPYSRLR